MAGRAQVPDNRAFVVIEHQVAVALHRQGSAVEQHGRVLGQAQVIEAWHSGPDGRPLRPMMLA